jgi:hypothetical protein
MAVGQWPVDRLFISSAGSLQGERFQFFEPLMERPPERAREIALENDFQARLDAQGADNNAQTWTRPYYSLTSGVNKSLFRDKAVITLDGTNILNMNKQKTLTTGADYVIYRVSNFNGARFRLGFSYRFSKTETSVFRSRKDSNRD